MTATENEVDKPASGSGAEHASGWTFLTNHSHVLICLAEEPTMRLRDLADRVGITERAVQRIVTDLEDAGFVTRIKDGRRNCYEIHPDHALRHSIESHCTVRDLIGFVRGR
ncbi:MAG: winged helix-turn-helix transcriptional regulator [Fibrella sp.]|nr:winged helix-turn-helix transcriptional regulator [Armatimonadota bacterium]